MSEELQMKTLVQKYWPNATTDEDFDNILWGTTSFPFGTIEYIESQLKEYAEKSGGNIGKAMAIVEEEMSASLKTILDQWEREELDEIERLGKAT